MDASMFKKCMITKSPKLFLTQFYGVPTTISDCMITWEISLDLIFIVFAESKATIGFFGGVHLVDERKL